MIHSAISRRTFAGAGLATAGLVWMGQSLDEPAAGRPGALLRRAGWLATASCGASCWWMLVTRTRSRVVPAAFASASRQRS